MTRELEFIDFMEAGLPMVGDPQGAFFGKGEGNVEKQPILFDGDDWKFLLQFPPALWSKALQWRYNEGMLLASEAREEANLNDDALPDYVDKVELKEDNGWVYTILPPPDQPKLYVGFRKLFKKLEAPVKIKNREDEPAVSNSKCHDPNEHEEVRKARERADAVEGPGIDELMLFPNHRTDATRDLNLHPKSAYKGGFYDFDLTKPNRVTDDQIENLADDDNEAKKMRENPPHTLAGMSVLQKQPASNILNAWIRGSAYVKDGDTFEPPILKPRTKMEPDKDSQGRPTGQMIEVVRDPYRSELAGEDIWMPIHRQKPSLSFKNPLIPFNNKHPLKDKLGKEDDTEFQTPGGETIKGRQMEVLVPVINKRVRYRRRTKVGLEEEVTPVLPMPILGDGSLLPGMRGDMVPEGEEDHVALSKAQREAFTKRVVRRQQKRVSNLQFEIEMLKARDKQSQIDPLSHEESEKLATLEAQHRKLTERLLHQRRKGSEHEETIQDIQRQREELERQMAPLLSRKPLSLADRSKLAGLESGIKKGELAADNPNEDWGRIGEITNLLRLYDLLTPAQRRHLRENQRDIYHAAAAANTNPATYWERWQDPYRGQQMRFVLGGFVPNYSQRRGGKAIPSDKDMLQSIIEKYFDYGAPGIEGNQYNYGGLKGEAKQGIERYMSNALGWTKQQESEDVPPGLAPVKQKARRKKPAQETGEDDSGLTPAQVQTVLQMMQDRLPDMVSTCAALLVLNLNNPQLGVYDPDLCLNRADPANSADAHARRVNYGYLFAWSLAQASIDSVPSRRQLKARQRFKGATGAGASTATGGVEDASSTGREGAGPAGNDFGGSIENMRIWYKTAKSQIARSQWLVSGKGTMLDAFFDPLAKQITSKLGSAMAEPARRLQKALNSLTGLANTLYVQALQELTDGGMPAEDPSKDEKAFEMVQKRLRNWITKHRPGMTMLSDEDIRQHLKDRGLNKLSMQIKARPGSPEDLSEWVLDFWQGLAEDGWAMFGEEGGDDEGDVYEVTPDNFRASGESTKRLTQLFSKEGSPLTDVGSIANFIVDIARQAKLRLQREVASREELDLRPGETKDPNQFDEIWWLDPPRIIAKFGVPIIRRVLDHFRTTMSTQQIIKELEKHGYYALEGKYDTSEPTPKKAPDKPLTTGLPKPVEKPAAAAQAPGRLAANPLGDLLSDPVGKVDEILKHPEVAKYKSHIKAAVAAIRQREQERRAEALRTGQPYKPSVAAITAIFKLNTFATNK